MPAQTHPATDSQSGNNRRNLLAVKNGAACHGHRLCSPRRLGVCGQVCQSLITLRHIANGRARPNFTASLQTSCRLAPFARLWLLMAVPLRAFASNAGEPAATTRLRRAPPAVYVLRRRYRFARSGCPARRSAPVFPHADARKHCGIPPKTRLHVRRQPREKAVSTICGCRDAGQ